MPDHAPPVTWRVALFITCLTDQFYPHVGIAVTKVLEKLGCSVEFPANQTCCGQPFYNNGFHPQTAELAKKFIEIFQDYDYVVTPSGSCATMMRSHYEQVLGNDASWQDGLKRVRRNTYEFVEFLVKVLRVDLSRFALPDQQRTTFHYTCHSRGLGLTTEASHLLKSLGNVDFVPLEKTDQCCGFGGTFAVKYPAISGAIVKDKADCIRATEAPVTVCNEAGCSMNISGMLHRHQVSSQLKHIAEIIAESMGLDYHQW
ncbi:MAG: (Fe-S)-binding protein [Phycisphaerales bacterium]|nr:(Fe-S)-binding protein [Phycisphaerales bacterium]